MNPNGVYIDYRKWPDTVHWHCTVYSLGYDIHGAWFCLPDGAAIQRGFEPPLTSRMSIMLLPGHASWIASFNTDRTKPYELYVDVIRLIKADSHQITMIDLDLDVVRMWDGRVEIVDRDEFELHRNILQYPDDLIEHAEKTAELLENLVRGGEEPFGAVGSAWLERAAVLSQE